MVYLTTTKLAVRLNLDRKDLFAMLNEWGWLERENDRWVLTDLGRKQGGQIRSTSDTGEFVVWPENISIVFEETSKESEEISASADYVENSEASEGETYIADYFDEIGIAYVTEQVIRQKLDDRYASHRVADFYLPKYDVYLEFAGRWNRSDKDRKRYRDKKQMYLDNRIPCIWIYPDNLGILHYIFHRRLESVLINHKIEKGLFRYRLGQLWKKDADNFTGIGIALFGLYYVFPWSDNTTWALVWGGVVAYNLYRIVPDINRIRNGRPIEVSRLNKWESD